MSFRSHRPSIPTCAIGLAAAVASIALPAGTALAQSGLPPGYCSVQCNGAAPVAPFAFASKAASSGDPTKGGPLGSTMQAPANYDGTGGMESVPSGEFFSKLDEFEAWSAKQCGESLNGAKDFVVVAMPCSQNQRTFNVWTNSVNAAHSKPGVKQPAQPVIDAFFEAAKAGQKALAEQEWFARLPNGRIDEKCETFPLAAGDKNVFAVGVSGNLCRKLTVPPVPSPGLRKGFIPGSRTDLAASASFDVAALGKQVQVVKGSANFSSPLGANPTGTASVALLGKTVWNQPMGSGAEIKYDKTIPLGAISESAKAYFSIGPVPIEVAAGLGGSAEVGLMARLAPMWANGRAVPKVNSYAQASAAVYLWIAKAGVEGTLTLLSDTLNIYGFTGVAWAPPAGGGAPTFIYSYQVAGENAIDALSGSVKAFAAIRVPKFLGWKWKKYAIDIFSWSGLHTSGLVFADMKNGQPIQ